MKARTLDAAVRGVVEAGNCSGCGACALIERGITMQLSPEGFVRPQLPPVISGGRRALADFQAVCPGVRVSAQRPGGSRYDPLLGPIVGIWEAWATDAAERHRGSSGGALTALNRWLRAQGRATQVVAASADAAEPRRTLPVVLGPGADGLETAGSRYAPVAMLASAEVLDPAGAVVAKPCEAAALRALTSRLGAPTAPLILSFFCAGTPSQRATDDLVERLGIPRGEELADLWYRGRGWPGRFTARARDGREVSTSYEDSWGRSLGPTVQWRCKICPDGIGESSDITAGDLWRTDARGYPEFAEGAGVSVLIARTARGQQVVQEAIAAGVLSATPISPAMVARVQPLQVKRRKTLAGRLIGARLAGLPVPRFRGFGLWSLAIRELRASVSTGRGTYARARRAKASPR